MKKNIFWLLLLMMTLHQISFSQNVNQSKYDSIYASMMKWPVNETTLDSFMNLSLDLLYNNFTINLPFAKRAVEIAESLKNKNKAANSYYLLGRVYWRSGKYLEARECHKHAFKLGMQLNDHEKMMLFASSMGQDYADEGKYNEANFYFEQVGQLAQVWNNKYWESTCYDLISWVYTQQGNFVEANDYEFKAYRLFQLLHDTMGCAVSLSNLATGQIELGNDSLAKVYLQECIAIFRKGNDKVNEGYSMIDLAMLHFRHNQFAASDSILQQVLKIAIDSHDYQMLGVINSKMAENATKLNSIDEAIHLYLKSVEYFNQVNSHIDLIGTYILLGKLYLEKAEKKTAKEYFDKAFTGLKQVDSKSAAANYYSNIEKLDSTNGNWHDAYFHYKLFNQLDQQLATDSAQKRFFQLSVQSEYDKKQAADSLKFLRDNTATQVKLQKQKVITYSGFFLVIISVVFLFSVYRNFKKQKLANKQLKETQQQLIRSEKLAAFGSVANRMSHEIQNPLNFVNNFAAISNELLDELNSASEEERKTAIEQLKINIPKIVQHGKRAESIIKELQQHHLAGTTHEFFEAEKKPN